MFPMIVNAHGLPMSAPSLLFCPHDYNIRTFKNMTRDAEWADERPVFNVDADVHDHSVVASAERTKLRQHSIVAATSTRLRAHGKSQNLMRSLARLRYRRCISQSPSLNPSGVTLRTPT